MDKIYRLDNIGLLSTDGNDNLILLDDSQNYKDMVDIRSNSELPISAPIYIDIYPSFVCNFKCIFCYNSFMGNWSNKEMMSKKTVDNIIKYCKKHGVFWINIVGGEPYHPKNWAIIKYIVKEAHKNNIKTDIVTNIYYVNKKIVDFCNKYNVRFNTSLLAFNKKTGTKITGIKNYNAISKINKYLNKEISFGISTPIIKQNKKEIFKICDYINSLSNCAWVLRYPTIPDQNDINLPIAEFYKISKELIKRCNKKVYFDAPFVYKRLNSGPPKNKLDKLYCGCKADFLKFEILPNGDVVSCILLKKKYGILGNINTKQDITTTIQFRNMKIKRKCTKNKCVYNSFCTGCPGYAILNNKSFDDRCKDCYENKRNCSK